MTIDFLIGAIRASRDLHPLVQTKLEEILRGIETDVQEGTECTEISAYAAERSSRRGRRSALSAEKKVSLF